MIQNQKRAEIKAKIQQTLQSFLSEVMNIASAAQDGQSLREAPSELQIGGNTQGQNDKDLEILFLKGQLDRRNKLLQEQVMRALS